MVYTEQGDKQIHTIYEPNSFIPLIRIEGARTRPTRTLAQKFEQATRSKLDQAESKQLKAIEAELRQGRIHPAARKYLNPEMTLQEMQNMLDPELTLEGKTIHFYHCDHLGTPIALISQKGELDWSIELDPWGNKVKEYNPKNLYQPIRFQGQHYDEESGLHCNRHRYYDPRLGRYITQDPIGLRGGGNWYQYPCNPIKKIDPLGLQYVGIPELNYDAYVYKQLSDFFDYSVSRVSGMWSNTSGEVSIDVGTSGNAGVGASKAVGLSVGKTKGDILPDVCAYLQLCEMLGAGFAGGVAVTGTVSNSGPTSGISNSAGVYATGGPIAKGSVSAQADVTNIDISGKLHLMSLKY